MLLRLVFFALLTSFALRADSITETAYSGPYGGVCATGVVPGETDAGCTGGASFILAFDSSLGTLQSVDSMTAEDAFPRRATAEETKFRGMRSPGWIDKNQDPWGATLKAFMRRDSDTDGVTVLPRPHLCCALQIRGIGSIGVAGIETIQNPIDKQYLYVEEDDSDHGYIVHVPFHNQHPQAAQDVATDLAGFCALLKESEFEEAKDRWMATKDSGPT